MRYLMIALVALLLTELPTGDSGSEGYFSTAAIVDHSSIAVQAELVDQVQEEQVFAARGARRVQAEPVLAARGARRVQAEPVLAARGARRTVDPPLLAARGARRLTNQVA